ncbi:MAG: IS66 family insertion sequence element accessory protein TnpB [Desulfobacterales bacterium]|nr:IS66 family insertion sequence element accessory protein TnpB [Desulfobacterales bacterium]
MATESKAEKLKRPGKFWKTHLEKWAESVLTQAEYCKQYQLVPHRFTYWKARYKQSQTYPVKFVQVFPQPKNVEPCALKLNISRGLQLEIPDNFNEDTLSRVLSTLKIT